MVVIKCAVLIFLFSLAKGQTDTGPSVRTDVGLIRGLRADDGDYSMYLGIPYAQVDMENPFGAAKPYPTFEHTFNALNDSITTICPQIIEFGNYSAGSLDCLNLNIFVPLSIPSNTTLPVLVWIFGGGYITGAGNRFLYGPKFLVTKNIILVTINYRLGPYGFMCLDSQKIPGNQGLKDQLLALRWIRRNIQAFGGDTNKVTISGQSAGSVSLDLLLLSNTEKLFNQAILQSGSAFAPSSKPPLRTAPIILASYLGFTTDSVDKALDFLSKANTHAVVTAVQNLGLELDFRPCVEKEYNGVENIITRNWNTVALPKIEKMPILIGFNSNEYYYRHRSEEDAYYQKLNLVHFYLSLAFNVDAKEFKGMEDTVNHFYFGDKLMSAALKQKVLDFESDIKLLHATYRTISRYLDNKAGNIFLYVFSYPGERNLVKHFYNLTSLEGATHGDELSYLFDVSFMKNVPVTEKDQKMIKQMTTLWTNFVKFGNPTPQTSDLLPVLWTPITSHSDTPYLNIDSNFTLGTRPLNERETFWDRLYKANEHLQIYDFNLKESSL